MDRGSRYRLAIAGTIALAVTFGFASSNVAIAASSRSGAAIDMSAQHEQLSAQRKHVQGVQRAVAPRISHPRIGGAHVTRQRITAPRVTGRRITGPRITGQRTTGGRIVAGRRDGRTLRGLRGGRGGDIVRFHHHGRNFHLFRGRRIIHRAGHLRHLVPFGILGGIYLGTQYYEPYGYVSLPAPECTGLTEDGCELRWQEVPTDEGEPELQCVAFCPAEQPPAPPATPAPQVAPPPPPAR